MFVAYLLRRGSYMRYFLLGCLILVVIPAFSYNETVTAIAYNPSRMGAYTHLKAAQKAILKGGLNVEERAPSADYNLVILSKNGVTLRDGSDTALTDRCPDAAACSQENQNEITTIKPEGYEPSANVCSTTGTPSPTCVTQLDAPYVMVQAISTTPLENYSYSNSATPAAEKRIAALAVYGGTFTAQASGADPASNIYQDSYIATIPNNGGDNGTVAQLKLVANEMLEVGGLYVFSSLKLGEVSITAVSPTTKYAFVERVFSSGAQKAKVLAVK